MRVEFATLIPDLPKFINIATREINAMVRVRFAPSPTGYLHIGGVRTALFNWLFARQNKGTFILRIEDTDLSRSTDESIHEIIAAMKWLGLDWDEGPFRQMERQDLYKKTVAKLLEEGKAYRCYCSQEELDSKRQEAQKQGQKPKYDGKCRNLKAQPQDLPFTVRFKTPPGSVTINDMLRGAIEFDNSELDDLIVQRTDGTPIYNFVVVVDDTDMKVTHVIRGDDHLSNTPRQALLYDSLDFPRPRFAHISMILGADKTRLSKRHGATSILAYRDMGYLPDAMLNYLARLGWSHGDQEIFTRQELVQHFSLENVTVSAAIFNPEKLLWVNTHHIKITPPVELARHLEPLLIREGVLQQNHGLTFEEIARPIPYLQERSKTLVEMAQGAAFYFKKEIEFDEKAKEKFLRAETKPLLEQLVLSLEKQEDYSTASIEPLVNAVAEQNSIKLGQLAQPVRVALTGKTVSPGIYEVIMLLGKARTIERLKNAIGLIK